MNKVTVHFVVHYDFSHISTALASLYENTQLPVDVYVTINAGQRSEVDGLIAQFPNIHIVVNKTPQGFAANHNRILRRAQTPFVALLNDDVFIHPQMLDRLVEHLERNPDVGLVGPKVLNPDGTPQLSVFSDPTLLRMLWRISGISRLTEQGGIIRNTVQRFRIATWLSPESLRPLDFDRSVSVVVGVSMIVRRSSCLDAGLMDEDTLVYGEEFGWHLRLRQHGWKVVFVSGACITHYNIEQKVQGWKLVEHRKGILNYFHRYRPRWQTRVIRGGIVMAHGLAAIFQIPFDSAQASAHWKTVQLGLTWSPQDNETI